MSLFAKRRRHREPLEFSLNITSLMDVLTVLLFFLLKSFTVSSAALTPPSDVRLPASVLESKIEETVVVSMSPHQITIGSEFTLPLNSGQFRAQDLAPDGRTLKPLKEFLDKSMAKRNQVFAPAIKPSDLPPGRLLVQVDREMPFSAVKYLLHTASAAGYSDYDFVVSNPDSD